MGTEPFAQERDETLCLGRQQARFGHGVDGGGQPPDQAHTVELEAAADRDRQRFISLVQHPHIGLCGAEAEAFVL